MVTACRLCASISLISIIEIGNFPKAAQNLPNKQQLKDDFPVVLGVCECADCGLVQLKNEPVDYYRDVITAATLSPIARQTISAELAEILPLGAEGKTAFEVGSARGGFLKLLKDVGLEPVGLEHNAESVEFARASGLEVIEGYLLDGVKTERTFDFIFCNNFMEHQPQIKNFISSLKDFLAPDGVLYISVPNLDRIVEKNCIYEFVTDHLVYFSANTLRRALEMNGLEVVRQYSKNNENDLVVIARNRSANNFKNANEFVEKIGLSIKNKINEAKKHGTKVVVWGAGHRTLALLSIQNITKIDYVVDNASFKQGRFTPITHQKIYPPERLLEDTNVAVIIMLPGSFSLEAKNFLLERGFTGKILVFEDKPFLMA